MWIALRSVAVISATYWSDHSRMKTPIKSFYNPRRQSRQPKKLYVYIYYERTEYGSHVNSITKLFRVEDAGESSFIRVMIWKLISRYHGWKTSHIPFKVWYMPMRRASRLHRQILHACERRWCQNTWCLLDCESSSLGSWEAILH